MNREIRQITPEYIEDYLTIYLNAYPAGKNPGEEGRDKYRPGILHSMENDTHIHFYGLFEDGSLIAQMKLIDFDINLFGKMKKATGLMALGVHPMHKKKGAALAMVKFFEKYTRESGAQVSMLLPFRMDFYRNMGYGYGSKMEEYTIPAANLPKASDDLLAGVRFIGADDKDTDMILDCYSSFVRKNHGMCEKFEDELRDYYDDDETKRAGYFDGERLRGYVTYDVLPDSDVNYTINRIEVKEIVYLDKDALAALLGFLRNQSDLAQTIKIRTGEPDFYHILPSAQDISGNYIDFGFLETNIGAIGTMYKITDPEFFVRSLPERRFIPCSLTARFDYYSELDHASGSVKIRFTEEGTWEIADRKAKADVNIECSLSDLSALFMGSAGFASLARLGAMRPDADYTNMLDLLFYTSQKPWTNTDY